jgi:cytochrome P450
MRLSFGERECSPGRTRLFHRLRAKRWDNPNELVLGRKKIAEHVGFGRGKHVCAGAPLARVEVRVIFEKLLAYTSKIALDPTKHPNGAADLIYEPSFIIRGLAEMHLKLTPARGFAEKA